MDINTSNALPSTPLVQGAEPNPQNSPNTLQTDTQTQTNNTDSVTLSSVGISLSNTTNTTESDSTTIDPQQEINALQSNIENDPEQAIDSQSAQITSEVVQDLLG